MRCGYADGFSVGADLRSLPRLDLGQRRDSFPLDAATHKIKFNASYSLPSLLDERVSAIEIVPQPPDSDVRKADKIRLSCQKSFDRRPTTKLFWGLSAHQDESAADSRQAKLISLQSRALVQVATRRTRTFSTLHQSLLFPVDPIAAANAVKPSSFPSHPVSAIFCDNIFWPHLAPRIRPPL